MSVVGAAPVPPGTRARVALPFALATLVWSSTWLVIRWQLGTVPVAWSVTYRFVIAAAGMTVFALATRAPLRLTARQHGFALCYGVAQYCLNYHAVYAAERSVTSGLVAVLFALLLVPNAILARVFLKQGVSRGFLAGSAIAFVGMALLCAHELRVAPAAGPLARGIGWSLAGVLAASVANVMQGTRTARGVAVASLVTWGMVWGAGVDAAVALAVDGAPVLPADARYWAGTVYLALVGSALAFSLYFHVVRAIGPARAAYTSVLTPALAMLLSTLFEGYRWTAEAALAVVLVLAGLVVALRARRQSANPAR